ncbi:TPA: hypothetical protein QC183_006539 [Bacillus cereus]|nr:hypothetical protein [Bacillus cereus]HDR8338251.1 hypothetical protein [Bacillus cereus]
MSATARSGFVPSEQTEVTLFAVGQEEMKHSDTMGDGVILQSGSFKKKKETDCKIIQLTSDSLRPFFGFGVGFYPLIFNFCFLGGDSIEEL